MMLVTIASQADQRAKVVAEAMTWLRTPYHHRGTVKGVGVDCAQFPMAVYVAAGLMQPADLGAYPVQWHMNHDQERYLEVVRRYARDIELTEVLPADFTVWKFGKTFAHGAIVVRWPLLIHAHQPNGVVLEDVGQSAQFSDCAGQRRPVMAFRPFPWCAP